MIGVVGGGIAGLAAAYRLQRHGYDVTVFEADDDLGGLASSYETAGDRIERFYHHLSRTEEAIVDLAEALGLGDRVEWRVGKNAYYVDGVAHPLDTPAQILAYPHLSLYDKLRLGLLTVGVDVRGGRPRFDAYTHLADYEDVPIRSFLLEHTTEGVYEYFFEPLLEAKFGDRRDDVSAAWLLGRIRFRGERDLRRGEILGYLEGGFGTLVDALVDAVGPDAIRTGAAVRDVEIADRVEAVTVEHDGRTERHAVDELVVTTMPHLLETWTGYRCGIEFQAAVCAVLSMDRPLTDTYWLNIADDAPFGALIEHTNFVPPSRYGGEHLLYVASYVQDRSDRIWQGSDDDLRAHWLDGIESLFPAFDRDRVDWMRIARAPRAAPIYTRGYLEEVVPYDLGDAVAPGLYYGGMASRAQYPERSLNGGVLAGFECADRIAGAAE